MFLPARQLTIALCFSSPLTRNMTWRARLSRAALNVTRSGGFGSIEYRKRVRRAGRGPPFVIWEQACGVTILPQAEQY
jgi:hypothetical protein